MFTRTVEVKPKTGKARELTCTIIENVLFSNRGVKFGGCQGEFKVGDKIEVLYRHKHTQARVAWIIACEGSSEKRIGAEFLKSEKQVWGVDFPEQTDEYEEKE